MHVQGAAQLAFDVTFFMVLIYDVIYDKCCTEYPSFVHFALLYVIYCTPTTVIFLTLFYFSTREKKRINKK